jgi:hypothetical protein
VFATLTISQMAIDISLLLQLPEHEYILQLRQYLPEAARNPVQVRDASAFGSFLSDPTKSFFNKFLALDSLNEATYMDQEHRFNGQRYVSSKSPCKADPIFTDAQAPPIARLLIQPGVPMFVVTACSNVLQVFLTSQEDRDPVLRELCKVSSLPSSILSFINRVCDDPAAQNNVQSPIMFVMDSMKQMCSIVIEACRIQRSASSGPSINAQALLPSCLHLLKRFKPLAEPHSLAGSQPPIKVNTEFFLDLLCATACLLYSSVPFPQDACRHFLTDLLRYIDIESDKSTKFAMLCCLGPTLAKLGSPAVASAPAASAALDSAASAPLQNGNYQQETIRALIKLLSQARRYPAPSAPPRTLTHHPHPPKPPGIFR